MYTFIVSKSLFSFIPMLIRVLCFYSTALIPGHTQPHRPRIHSGARDLRPRPSRPGSIQRARPGNVRPQETQILCRGAEATAHDQKSPQGLHSRRPEGDVPLCLCDCELGGSSGETGAVVK